MSNTISINDPDVTMLALSRFIEGRGKVSVEFSDKEYHLELEEVLKRMPASMFVTTCQSCMDVSVTIDVPKLLKFASKVESEYKRLLDFDWAIKSGASNKLLEQLFPSDFDRAEIARLRSTLDKKHREFVKKSAIRDVNIQAEVAHQWGLFSNETTLSLIERYKQLHSYFEEQYDLSQLYYVLKDYNLLHLQNGG